MQFKGIKYKIKVSKYKIGVALQNVQQYFHSYLKN